MITVDDTGEPPVVTPPTGPLHPNLMWPTLSGIDEIEARRICEAPIIQSPAFAVCSNFTEESLDVIIDSCMLDLLVYIVHYHVPSLFNLPSFLTLVWLGLGCPHKGSIRIIMAARMGITSRFYRQDALVAGYPAVLTN